VIILVVCVDAGGVRGAVFDMAGGEELLGTVQARVGSADHAAAARELLHQLLSKPVVRDRGGASGVGLLVPHGGPLTEPRPIDDAVRASMAEHAAQAPVHNPACLRVLDVLRERLPGVPLVAVFDTAFAATIDRSGASRVPSPRYGFHGARHRYIATRMADLAPVQTPGRQKIISCHLDVPSSVYAIANRQAVACSCGGSYGTGIPAPAIAGERDAAKGDDPAAERDMSALVESVRGYVLAYLALLEGADTICFSGSLGQGSPRIRAAVLDGLAVPGRGAIALDPVQNEAVRERGRIDAADSAVRVWVLPAFEQIIIARQTLETLNDVEARRSVFTKIYQQNHWQGASKSGTGSDLGQTAALRAALRAAVAELNIKTLLDAPCGDYFWMQAADLPLEKYIGMDIVPALIAANQQRYGSSEGGPGSASAAREFIVRDIVREPLPKVDAIFCRDCLVHLTFADIQAALRNFKASGARYLLTTTFAAQRENADIFTGMWRPLNLERPPFNLPSPWRLIHEHCTEENGKYADKCIGVWELEGLRI
jgi:acetate kinase